MTPDRILYEFDLAAAAFEADITRVFTFMMSRELSQRTYPQIGVTEQHHSVSHHLNQPEKMAQMVKVKVYYATMYARFLEKLRKTPDGDGSIFDHSLLVYGAGMGDSNGHASDPLPMILTGGGVTRGDRHVQLPTRTPIGLRLGSETIEIPPGASEYVVADRYQLPVDVEVLAVQPHAHNLARFGGRPGNTLAERDVIDIHAQVVADAEQMAQGFGVVVIGFAALSYFQYDTLIVAWLTHFYPNGQIGL